MPSETSRGLITGTGEFGPIIKLIGIKICTVNTSYRCFGYWRDDRTLVAEGRMYLLILLKL
jgi:hypothetical protein